MLSYCAREWQAFYTKFDCLWPYSLSSVSHIVNLTSARPAGF